MKVLLLAAGRSRRMKPLKDKNFLQFLGKPLVQHQLEALHEAGFGDVVVVGGAHNLKEIEALGAELKMNVSVAEQKDLDAGMCGAVIAAKNHIMDGPVMVVSSNDVLDKEAFELMKKAEGADSFILAKKVSEYFPGGYLEMDDGGMIKRIVEKPGEGNEPSDLVNLVAHLHNDGAKLAAYMEAAESDEDDLYEVALTNMIKDGIRMKAVPYDGFWQPIKFPWHVQEVFKYFFDKAKKGVSKNAQIAKNAIINGDVIIEDDVKILDGAQVNGPAYIGRGSVVATNALVRDSNIGERCVVGFSTEIARSFLGNDVWTHSNYIGDSVIGNNVSFGAGCVTGNLRLDEKNIGETGSNKFGLVCGDNVRFGINTSVMPGVRVGGGSFIGAGIVVAEDIPENSFARGNWELKISENKHDVSGMDRGENMGDLKNGS